MKMKKLIKRFGVIVLLLVLLYTSFNAILTFSSGQHNLDTAQNFLQLGYSQDINMDGKIINLKEYYLYGLNQMKNGFMWICFDVILGVLLGYSIKKGEFK